VSSQPLLPRCTVCRQRLLCVDGPEVAPIGAARIVRVDRQTGTVTVICVCGAVRDWELRQVTMTCVR
jgi:hypothetical protein